MFFIKNNMLLVVCSLGVFQAVLVNVLGVNLPLLTLFSIIYIVLDSLGKSRYMMVTYNLFFYLLLGGLLFVFIYAIILNHENIKQISYHVNVMLALLFGKTVCKDQNVQLKIPKFFIWSYMVISILIYFLAWDKVAAIIGGGEDSLGLKTNGFKRSYGLLFNPLANAYFLLIIYYFVYATYEKGHVWLKMALLFSVLLAITRGAMVSIFLFLALYLFYRKKWMIILAAMVVAVICYLTIEPVTIIVDSIVKMEDTQGSAQGHEESMREAIDIILANPLGTGFSDNHTESWILNYGLYYGFVGVAILCLFFSYIALGLLMKKKFFYFILFLSFLPITLIIPFHTFNLPILLFFLFSYCLFYNAPHNEYRI